MLEKKLSGKNLKKKILEKKCGEIFFFNLEKKFKKKVLKKKFQEKILKKSFDKKNFGKINYKTKIFITKIYRNNVKCHRTKKRGKDREQLKRLWHMI